MSSNIKNKQKIISIMIVCVIICSLAIAYLLFYMPVRNYDYFYNDLEGDVENYLEGYELDDDIDIICVQSHDDGNYVILEMKVSGIIAANNSSRYHLIMVMKDVENNNQEGYIYDFIYTNGIIEHYNCEFSVVNNSLTIFVPKNLFQDYEYMVGLEGYTQGYDGYDSCRESQERFNPITYGLMGAVSGIIFGTVIILYFKYKIFSIFHLLSSRLKHETIPDQFVRGQIYGLIRAKPGIHYSGIKSILNVGNGTLAYHLSVLEKEEFIKSKSSAYYKQFYPTELPLQLDELGTMYPKGLEGIMYSDIQERILKIIREKPGIAQTEIVSVLKLPKQTVSYNIKSLVQTGTIRVTREGNTNKCFVIEGITGDMNL